MKTRISTRARWAVLISATALVATGCAQSTSGDDAKNARDSIEYSTGLVNVSEPSGDPVKGGTLRVAEYSEARVLDPTQTYPTGSTGGNVMAAVYDTLVRYNYENDTFEPQLAESIESADNTTWTIKLRKDVKFHDGTPLDADAVIGSISRYSAAYGLNSLLLKQEIKSMKALDPQTVEIVTTHAWPRFPNTLANGAGMILAPAAYKNPASFKPIGAGPFKFKSYAPAEKTVVEANEDYWAGRPALDAIEFVLLGADNASYDTFKTGGVDVAFVRSTAVVDEALKDGVTGMSTYVGLSNNLWINNREGRPGADKRVRQAIALAFDPELYLKRTAEGAGEPSKLYLAARSPWAPGVDPLPTDRDKAKELLDEAKADGFDGKISITGRTEQASQTASLAVQSMLEAVGFEVALDLVPTVADQLKKIYADRDFDMAIASTSVPQEDVFGRLISSLNSQSPTNVPGYANPEMDKLIQELQPIDDPAEAKDVLTKIEALWAEDAPGVAISSGAMLNIWNPKVHGVVPSSETIVLFDKAWMEK